MARHGWSRSKVYTTKFRALAWLRERLIALQPRPPRRGEAAGE